MAHKNLWYQGKAEWQAVKCDGRPSFTCPSSTRIAAEYNRGYFTLTNVLNPNIHYDNLGIESWLYKELEQAAVGDHLWLVLVPPKHHTSDVFLYNEATFTETSSLESMAGVNLSLVTGVFKAADKDGNCEMTKEVNHGTVIFPTTAKPQFLRVATDITNDPETWLGVGIKVEALPDGKTLADVVGKIVVGCHALDYDAQTFM